MVTIVVGVTVVCSTCCSISPSSPNPHSRIVHSLVIMGQKYPLGIKLMLKIVNFLILANDCSFLLMGDERYIAEFFILIVITQLYKEGCGFCRHTERANLEVWYKKWGKNVRI